ncbi:SGNH/GDSL hydrolase family protein [Streptomyces hoynatensis]|uniref:SGNH/GDSL hydrolase family protein n=1 Tax=Streptomyces hoynatensis TaxID=1141874 RepID=A0A3A9YZV9_9ACTN|nr:SGNH/GDSL hydrolase family protein [Streptomyces hoynatensis]RKN41234.1 SGNH/GDSL hydrolase family protein [Streptomyces hoynatensis]
MSGPRHGWAASWTASPQRPGAGFAPNWSQEGFAGQTLRQTVRLSIGGERLRIRLSHRYGTAPLRVAGLTLGAGAGGAAVEPGTLHEVTVNGRAAFTVPAGADLATDAVPLTAGALSRVTLSLYLAEPSGPATYHAQALTTTYRAEGDHRADLGGTGFAAASASWYFLSGVDVAPGPGDGIVVLGDSLTDGTGSTPGADRRFPDRLAERLAAAGRPRAVLNQGIGGNRVTVDSPWLGERATARFRRDVLEQPGVGTVLVLAGINDIALGGLDGNSPFPVLAPYPRVTAQEVVAGHLDMIRRARAAGLRTVGATLPPMRGSLFSTPEGEAARAAVNAWIRESGEYDAVADLARALGDALDPAHDSGDHLHPSDAGYLAMAEAVDLDRL